MKDLPLNFSGTDITLTEPVTLIDGPRAVIQRLVIRFKTFLGEYFLDAGAGLPYRQAILVKNPDLEQIRSLFRAEIIDCPGILELLSLDTDFDPFSRSLAITFRATIQASVSESVISSDVRLEFGLDDGSTLYFFDYNAPVQS